MYPYCLEILSDYLVSVIRFHNTRFCFFPTEGMLYNVLYLLKHNAPLLFNLLDYPVHSGITRLVLQTSPTHVHVCIQCEKNGCLHARHQSYFNNKLLSGLPTWNRDLAYLKLQKIVFFVFLAYYLSYYFVNLRNAYQNAIFCSFFNIVDLW